jgi:hypothetical protein
MRSHNGVTEPGQAILCTQSHSFVSLLVACPTCPSPASCSYCRFMIVQMDVDFHLGSATDVAALFNSERGSTLSGRPVFRAIVKLTVVAGIQARLR